MRSFSIILAAKKVAADFAVFSLNSIVKLYNTIHKSIQLNSIGAFFCFLSPSNACNFSILLACCQWSTMLANDGSKKLALFTMNKISMSEHFICIQTAKPRLCSPVSCVDLKSQTYKPARISYRAF